MKESNPIIYKRYKLIKKIGSGGMGKVYKAHDIKMKRDVALKILKKKGYKKRFLREIDKLADCNHPNIVHIYDKGEENGVLFFVMELIQGETLKEKRNQLNIHKILNISIQVADALDYVHKKGIFHRDIKPSNIMINKDFNAKLIDFSIAKSIDPSETPLTAHKGIMGSYSYMSPEQIKNNGVDGRSDIFSLGIILYEFVTGTHPFKVKNSYETMKAIVEKIPDEPHLLNASINKGLSKIIMKTLHKRKDKRFREGKEMAKAIIKINERKTEKIFNKISINNISIPSKFINNNKEHSEVENNKIDPFKGNVSKEVYKQIFGLNNERRPVSYTKSDYIDNNNDTISDILTGLMWQKSGSEIDMIYKNTQIYIDEINSRYFAGYNDWRLSTMEELITLLEPQKSADKLYINPIFDKKQDWCWSLNSRSSDFVWCIDFRTGCVDYSQLDAINYVRAVRFINP